MLRTVKKSVIGSFWISYIGIVIDRLKIERNLFSNLVYLVTALSADDNHIFI